MKRISNLGVILFFVFKAVFSLTAVGQIDLTTSLFPGIEDVEYLNEGLAIVRKGTLYAVIDDKGKFVVPYGKYRYTDFGTGLHHGSPGFLNGACIVQRSGSFLLGFIDRNGTEITPCKYLIVDNFDEEGWAAVTDTNHHKLFVDLKGNEIPAATVFIQYHNERTGNLEAMFMGQEMYRIEFMSKVANVAKFRDGLSAGKQDQKLGYYNRAGKKVIDAIYSSAEPFSEGLACVGRYNEHGEYRYGFINAKGEVKIPFQFSNKPGNFSCGYALVEPKDNSEFDFCFINKKGDFVFPQKGFDPIKHEGEVGFEEGYFKMRSKSNRNLVRIIDAKGNDVEAFSRLSNRIVAKRLVAPIRNHIQIFEYLDSNNISFYGFINLKSGETVFTDFCHLFPFDRYSGLAQAQYYNEIKPKNGHRYQDLIINTKGKVVITTELLDKW